MNKTPLIARATANNRGEITIFGRFLGGSIRSALGGVADERLRARRDLESNGESWPVPGAAEPWSADLGRYTPQVSTRDDDQVATAKTLRRQLQQRCRVDNGTEPVERLTTC